MILLRHLQDSCRLKIRALSVRPGLDVSQAWKEANLKGNPHGENLSVCGVNLARNAEWEGEDVWAKVLPETFRPG